MFELRAHSRLLFALRSAFRLLLLAAPDDKGTCTIFFLIAITMRAEDLRSRGCLEVRESWLSSLDRLEVELVVRTTLAALSLVGTNSQACGGGGLAVLVNWGGLLVEVLRRHSAWVVLIQE